MEELRNQRRVLAAAERDSYSPEYFPGTAKWMLNRKAAAALKAFDAEHPEIITAIKKEVARAQKEKFEGLSDFVKSGS